MATNAGNVRIGQSGAVFVAPTGSTAPTDTTAASVGASFVDLGYIKDDGMEITIPGSGDSNAIKAWQNAETVRTVVTPSEDLPTFHFTLIETKLETVELYFGVEVTQGATEGSFDYVVKNRERQAFIVDVIDGAELQRYFLPYGLVTDLGSFTASNGGDPIGYEITIAADRDPLLDINFRQFSTALKAAA